jgi:hypothetical protein
MKTADKDECISFVFARPADVGHQPVIITAPLFFGTEAEGKACFKDLLEIGPIVEHLQAMPYMAVNGMLNGMLPFGGRRNMGGASFTCPLDAVKVQAAFDEYIAFTAETGVNDCMWIWEMLPNQKIREVPLDSMAFPNRGDYYNLALLANWDDPALDGKMRSWMRDTGHKLKHEFGPKDTKGAGVYSNYVCKC